LAMPMTLTAVVFGLLLNQMTAVKIGVALIIASFFPHRTATHSLIALLIATIFAPYPLALGIATHLILDIISGGIPLLWPWHKPFGHRVFFTGGAGEAIVKIASIGLMMFMFYTG